MRIPLFPRKTGDRIVLGLAIILTLVAVVFGSASGIVAHTPERSDQVAEFIGNFGETVDLVQLSGTPEEAAAAMEAQYPSFVSRDLLDRWKADPSLAVGRRGNVAIEGITVKSVRNVGPLSYVVRARIIEKVPVTIPGLGTGTMKQEREVFFGVVYQGGWWKIIEYSVAPAEEEAPAVVPVAQ